MKQRLVPLGIPNVRFEIAFADKGLSSNGTDKVSFLFSANKSTPLQPVTQVASGGEIARVMLSLKAMISGAVKFPTIIFDEIDTGVSGKIAEKMADIMAEMGHLERQVISITHLPQIAAKGSHHYKVLKEETEQGTISQMKELNSEQRVEEIAQMLSGSDITQAALANARELLRSNRPYKRLFLKYEENIYDYVGTDAGSIVPLRSTGSCAEISQERIYSHHLQQGWKHHFIHAGCIY